MPLTSRHIIKILQANGWTHTKTTGDHWKFVDPTGTKTTIVTHPRKDLPKGTIGAIERQTGLKLRKGK